jgi:hypothetical protein
MSASVMIPTGGLDLSPHLDHGRYGLAGKAALAVNLLLFLSWWEKAVIDVPDHRRDRSRFAGHAASRW